MTMSKYGFLWPKPKKLQKSKEKIKTQGTLIKQMCQYKNAFIADHCFARHITFEII